MTTDHHTAPPHQAHGHAHAHPHRGHAGHAHAPGCRWRLLAGVWRVRKA